MRLADKRLQDMTNEFIVRFLAMAHVIHVEENPKKEILANSHDGYAFNYDLAECIAHSDFALKQIQERDDYPLIGSGLPANIVKGFFANSILGIKDDVAFVIDNFDNQDKTLDYYIKNLKDNTIDKVVDSINVEYYIKGVGEKTVKENEKQRTVSFTIHNAKSGYDGACKVFYRNGKMDSMIVSGKGGTHVEINRNEEPTITHFRHVADINSFFLMIDQVKYGIRDTLKNKK